MKELTPFYTCDNRELQTDDCVKCGSSASKLRYFPKDYPFFHVEGGLDCCINDECVVWTCARCGHDKGFSKPMDYNGKED